eukprot:840680-Amphidinium_carterae.1
MPSSRASSKKAENSENDHFEANFFNNYGLRTLHCEHMAPSVCEYGDLQHAHFRHKATAIA